MKNPEDMTNDELADLFEAYFVVNINEVHPNKREEFSNRRNSIREELKNRLRAQRKAGMSQDMSIREALSLPRGKLSLVKCK